MAKAKRKSPTSIRLSPDSEAWIQQLQTHTGWSVSRVLEHCVAVARKVQNDDAAGTRLLKNLLKTAAESFAMCKKADDITATAKSSVRKAAAAVKEAK
jgi:hypothetical protein